MWKKKLIRKYYKTDFETMVKYCLELGVLTQHRIDQCLVAYVEAEDRDEVIFNFFDFIEISDNEFQEITVELLNEEMDK